MSEGGEMYPVSDRADLIRKEFDGNPRVRVVMDCPAIGEPKTSVLVDGVPIEVWIGVYDTPIGDFVGRIYKALKKQPVAEAVDHPAHYGGANNPYEAIKVIEAWELGFCLGNTVKYIARAGLKGDRLEDLKKARWYLDREIARMEGEHE